MMRMSERRIVEWILTGSQIVYVSANGYVGNTPQNDEDDEAWLEVDGVRVEERFERVIRMDRKHFAVTDVGTKRPNGQIVHGLRLTPDGIVRAIKEHVLLVHYKVEGFTSEGIQARLTYSSRVSSSGISDSVVLGLIKSGALTLGPLLKIGFIPVLPA